MSPVDDELRPAHWDEPYPFDVWISDDDDRVPIQIRVDSRLGGVVVFQAVSYSRP
jgi:hypothetical protein